MGTDAMLADIQSRIEKETSFQEKLVTDAQQAGRDLSDGDTELYDRSLAELRRLEPQLTRVLESRRIGEDSAAKFAAVQTAYQRPAPQSKVEYRSAGAWVLDYYHAALGNADAADRVNTYERAAAHQTTPDNMGVIPEPVVGDVINYVDAARPIVSALGVRPAPGGRFTRPRVTQHTDVAAQSAEKTELTSRKMLISPVQVLMATYGGYVNVSRQNIDWSVPSIMDMVISDLAGQYAIETEAAAATSFTTNSTAGPTIPTGPADSADVLAAIWTAAASAWTAVQGVGRLVLAVPPDLLGVLGPLFPPYNAQNASGMGFSAAGFGSGQVGTISGISVVMSSALAAGAMLLINTAAAEVYEQRVGSLQVTEPSVMGVQVAYAGYFAPVVIESAGIVKIVKTP